ncbi:hypothetical protein DFH08DRAFT_818693 [Mycena albidolilacea]|uniref:Uncharacterized protein n=1 Tax=Mycena albidolilacea TaxID=1033008 RepID=A0AAD7EFX2_9AGAR|nr:hypothetical protein DFH08DRAFT_818693 [Mycena albidolilacea]
MRTSPPESGDNNCQGAVVASSRFINSGLQDTAKVAVKSPTKKWHPPMVQRDPSLLPIASFDELSSSGDTFPSTACQLRIGEVGTIHILPELPNETNAMWLPAALVDFDLSRTGREYNFEWIPGIVWRVREPENLVFYRSLSQWEELEDVLPLNEDQLGTLHLPGCFRPVTEDADTPDEQLSQLLLLAVPKIAQILATDASNLVLQHFVAHFKETPWNVEASLSWMKSLVFYRRAMHSDSEAAASMPAIHIVHKGQPILFPSDLPQAELQKKRAFIGEDVFNEEPAPKRHRKYSPAPTPPGVRRSTCTRKAPL